MEDKLTPEEQKTLLRLARDALEMGVRGRPLPPLDPSTMTPRLREAGASFVTLTVGKDLRGCIGALEPYQSLAEDVREHAFDNAVADKLPLEVHQGLAQMGPLAACRSSARDSLICP